MNRTGRPKTAPARFTNGFYLEVQSGQGAVKIRRESKDELLKAASLYGSKRVVILGEHKDGHWMSKPKIASFHY